MPDPALPLSASTLVLQARQRETEAVHQLAGRVELVEVLGQLIHALQRERGASSVYLASQGRRFADVRLASVSETRPIEARLREVFGLHLQPAHGATPRMLSLMAWVLLGLEALEELRQQIDRQVPSAHDSVAAFSRLIAGPVELIFLVADATLLPGVSRLLVALPYLVQGNEAAGQERAIGALLYASGRCTEAHQQRVVHLIDAHERSMQVFAEFADAPLRANWEQHQLSPGAARLERLRRSLCTAKPGAALDSTLSDAWFEASSERIGGLRQLQIELVERLRLACEAQIDEARKSLRDSESLLQRLRDNPPPHAHAVERFFDISNRPEAAPELMSAAGGHESATLIELLQAQSARLAIMEAELDAARRALHERKVIERAKGVLMSRMGLTEEAAQRALQQTSMDQNRRLVDIAEATLSLPDFAFAPPANGMKPA